MCTWISQWFWAKKLFLFFKINFTRINHCKFSHHKSHFEPFLSYLPCIVGREYFSIILNVKQCAILDKIQYLSSEEVLAGYEALVVVDDRAHFWKLNCHDWWKKLLGFTNSNDMLIVIKYLYKWCYRLIIYWLPIFQFVLYLPGLVLAKKRFSR